MDAQPHTRAESVDEELSRRERMVRKALLGDWRPLLRDPLDAARLSFVVAGVLYLLAGKADSAFALLLAFVVLMVAWRLRLPRVFDALFIVGVGLSAWGNAAGLFDRIDKWDNLVHFIFPMSAVPVLYVLNVRLGLLPELAEVKQPRHRLALVVFAVMAGVSAGAFYEIYEYVINNWLGADIEIGYADTIWDLTLDGAGALLGGTVLMSWAATNWPTVREPAT